MKEVTTALHIHIDVLPGPMLAVQDNGGGLTRGALHGMMSFGVSSDSSAGGVRMTRALTLTLTPALVPTPTPTLSRPRRRCAHRPLRQRLQVVEHAPRC